MLMPRVCVCECSMPIKIVHYLCFAAAQWDSQYIYVIVLCIVARLWLAAGAVVMYCATAWGLKLPSIWINTGTGVCYCIKMLFLFICSGENCLNFMRSYRLLDGLSDLKKYLFSTIIFIRLCNCRCSFLGQFRLLINGIICNCELKNIYISVLHILI